MTPLFEFLFPGRLHRVAYFVRLMVLNLITALLYSFSTTMNPIVWWGCLAALFIYGLLFVVLPRLRDIGMSPWWIPVMFIPVINGVLGIILLFRKPALLSNSKPNPAFDPIPTVF